MERRFKVRLRELVEDAVVAPEVFAGLLPRIERFVAPFAAALVRCEQRRHVSEYVAGLLSGVDRKNAESIAYLHDQERQPLQKFLGQVAWDHRPLVAELTRQIGREIGEYDGVLVIDPSAFPKKGAHSVGVERQWCGRLGKVDNCQVGVFLAYASRAEHALVNFRLYLPKSWAHDRARRKRCGVPKHVRFQTRHELALAMLAESAAQVPHAWIAGDDELGRNSGFRGELRSRGEHYVLAVPSNTLVRAVHTTPPEYAGHGRPPQVPFTRVDRWCAALANDVWTTIDVRDAEQGPLQAEAVMTRVLAKTAARQVGPEEMLLVLRARQGDGTWKHDYHLCHAPRDTPLAELVRVAKAEHRVEDCFQRAKSEAGLAHYKVRTWPGWHHHITLSLLATWFLTLEARREKKYRPGDDRASSPTNDRTLAA
ncbi:MAG: IS701 family transposase [Planctomycetia bacterium]|nr:IS701 family transposase [Planctomycetia bacterium]